jgi:hypothetical protein
VPSPLDLQDVSEGSPAGPLQLRPALSIPP